MQTEESSVRRLSLSVLYKLVDLKTDDLIFYDFCFNKICSVKETVGVRTLCIKLCYRYVNSYKELKHELKTLLEMMDSEQSQAVISARDNTLKLLHKR